MNDDVNEIVEPEAEMPLEVDAKSKLTTKDWLSLIFSATALVISATSFYVSNLRVENNTLARITDVTVSAVEPDDSTNGYRNGHIVLKIALVNAGNRPSIVTGATYQLSDQPNLDNGGFGGEVTVDPGTFPLLIAPKELRLINVMIPVKGVTENFENGAKIAPSAENGGRDLRKFFAGLRYEAIDSEGAQHSNWSGMEVAIEVSKNGWNGLGMADPKRQFSLTQLLK